MLKPGTILADYNKEVGKIMESELIGLGLLDKDKVQKQDPENPCIKKILYAWHFAFHGYRCT